MRSYKDLRSVAFDVVATAPSALGLDAAGMAHLRAELERRALARQSCIILTSHLDPQLPVARTLDLDRQA